MRTWTALLLAPLALGCIIEAPTGEKKNPNQAKALVSNVPPVTVRNGANLEDKVEIAGATVAPGQGTPGEAVRVTAYFRVLNDIDADYKVFVHIEDPDGRIERINADHAPAGGNYPTRNWKKGETVKDEFMVYVPAGVPLRALNVWIGMWEPDSDSRMQLKNPEAVRNDGNSRILLVQVPVAN